VEARGIGARQKGEAEAKDEEEEVRKEKEDGVLRELGLKTQLRAAPGT